MIDKIVGEAATKDSCCPDLDYKTRIVGFCITFGIGILCYMFSFSLLVTPNIFLLVFTAGSICLQWLHFSYVVLSNNGKI